MESDMARKKGAQDGMMLGVWEWCGDVGKATGHGVQISLVPARRLGVFRVQLRALVLVDGEARGIACKVGAEWPDAEGRDLGSFILWLAMQLDKVLAEEDLDQGAGV